MLPVELVKLILLKQLWCIFCTSLFKAVQHKTLHKPLETSVWIAYHKSSHIFSQQPLYVSLSISSNIFLATSACIA